MTDKSIRVRAITVYVVESDRRELRFANHDWPHQSVERAWNECANAFMFESGRYDAPPPPEPEGWWERREKVVARLTRLLAFWNRAHVASEPQPEIVICAAIRMPDGYIVRGHRHCHCIVTAYAIPRYAENWECPHGDDQGFVSSRGRYVTREEGLALQLAAGMPSADPSGYRKRELFSEDLY